MNKNHITLVTNIGIQGEALSLQLIIRSQMQFLVAIFTHHKHDQATRRRLLAN